MVKDIMIIDDDRVMAECVARFAHPAQARIFSNAIAAMDAIDQQIPDLIFLDILLDGPDGFTFLNELASYSDTAKIPIVVVSSLKIPTDLSSYNVIKVLDKSTMTPEDIKCLI